MSLLLVLQHLQILAPKPSRCGASLCTSEGGQAERSDAEKARGFGEVCFVLNAKGGEVWIQNRTSCDIYIYMYTYMYMYI